MLKRDRVKEIFNLEVALIESVDILMLVASYIAVWNKICCCLGEFSMLNGCAKLNLMCI